ncbi:S8 family serine peptidase [Mesobacterium pallidum]|uniref:S8 family serine peptidase n=1 Tax=Mesobacterium pallidum TaxID=2872037 RepID=UPI001EE241C3|nr:S8 family serine peptidase [Mesobacterium pallidum]
MTIDPKALTTRHFTWKTAYTLCEASRLAYDPPERLQQTLRDTWKMRGQAFSVGETQGFVAANDAVIIVSFRGTQGLADWGDNLRAGWTEFAPLGGDAHAGFVGCWARASDIVDRVLAQAGGKAIWFTGHSLGGALALLGAATHADKGLAGLVTFGQPRLLGRRSAERMHQLFGARYTRIVNANDIVAKVAPYFRHTGALFHFDRYGDLSEDVLPEDSDTRAELSDDPGPPPLDEAEYTALVNEIERLKEDQAAQIAQGSPLVLEEETGAPLVFADDLNAAIEGQVIGVAAHRIGRYVDLTRAMAFPPGVPDLRAAVANLRPRSRTASGDTPTFVDFDISEISPFEMGIAPTSHGAPPDPVPAQRQPILIRLRGSGDWAPPPGLEIGSRVERVVTAFATAEDLVALADHPRVSGIEVSREAGVLELESSMPFTGGSAVHRPPIAEQGDAALVGIVDTGVDILHQAFRDATGTATRIVAIWDQRGSGGATPRSLNPAVFSQSYGRVYLADEINAFIADHAAGTPSHPRRLRDPDRLGQGGHGTHVAGIAAGRAVGTHPAGMAPEAGIVVVMSALAHATDDPTSIGYSVSHVDAVQFLKGVAEGALPSSPGIRPIAINVSQGMNAGAHDGTSLLEAAFDMATGIGRDEGIVIVKSAGNERAERGHASKALFQGVELIEWDSDATVQRTDYFEGWFDARNDVAFRVIGPSGRATQQVTFESPDTAADLDGARVELSLTRSHRDNGDHRLALTIRQGAGQPPTTGSSQTWALELEGRDIRSQDQRFHFWAERTGVRATRFLVPDESATLSIPGTARTVICVGASNAELPIRMNRSSSQGLTRSGEFKPDLAAPGHKVVSAMSGQPALDAVVAKTGTSMAAPHVTGALALVLSQRAKAGGRQLNAEQLKSGLVVTSRPVGATHHPLAGYGILDVAALLDHFKGFA